MKKNKNHKSKKIIVGMAIACLFSCLLGGAGGFFLRNAIVADTVVEETNTPGTNTGEPDVDPAVPDVDLFLADLSPLGLGPNDSLLMNKIDFGYLISTSNSEKGIWFCDDKTHAVTQVYSSGRNWHNVVKVDDGYLIWSTSINDTLGLLLFKVSTRNIVEIDTSFSFTVSFVVPGGCLLSPKSLDKVLFYDSNKQSLEEVLSISKIARNSFIDAGEGCLITSATQDTLGVYFFDYSTHVVSTVYSDGYGWQLVQNVDGGCLLSSNYSVNKGLLFFDKSTHKISTIRSDGSGWKVIQEVKGGLLLTSSSVNGVYFYNNSLRSVSEVYSENKSWTVLQDVNDGFLLKSSVADSGLLFYDKSTGKCTQIYSQGNNWNHFYKIGKWCLISSSNRSCQALIYNVSQHTVDPLDNEYVLYGELYSKAVPGGFIVACQSSPLFYFGDNGNYYMLDSNYVEGDSFLSIDVQDGLVLCFDLPSNKGAIVYHFKNFEHSVDVICAVQRVSASLSRFVKTDGGLILTFTGNYRVFIDLETFEVRNILNDIS